MLLLAAALPVASAAPVLVRVRGPAAPLEAPVVLRAGAAAWPMRDDGRPPDPARSDGVWTAVASATPGATAALELTEGGGRAWSATLSWPAGDVAELELATTGDGALVVSEAPAGAPPPAAALPAGGDAAPQPGAGSWAWAAAALGWGLALSGALARLRRRPRPLAEARSPLGEHCYVVPTGQAAAAAGLLCAEHRLLVVGGAADAPPGGAAFAPDSDDPADVAAALRDLVGRGRPLAVLLTSTAALDLEGVLSACRGLPVVVVTDAPVPGARPLGVGGG